jgi:histone deacetylase 11
LKKYFYKKTFFILLFLTSFQVTQSASNAKIPFVYHPGYNISVLGLENFHPFDTHKYAHIVERLKKHFNWTDDQFHRPRQATDEELKEFHAPEYIDSLNQSWKELFIRAAGFGILLAGLSQFVNLGNHRIKLIIAGIYALWGLRPFQAKAYSQGLGDNDGLKIPFMLLPGPLLRYCFLRPMKLAVNGTAMALEKALDPNNPKFCVNLSGGYHHARSAGGGGFCFFNDTALALKEQIKKNKDFKALIIDLDFHCGDGNADFASKYRDNVTIIDIYGGKSYPLDFIRSVDLEKLITYANPIVERKTLFWDSDRPNSVLKGEKNSHWYCNLVRQNLEKVSAQHFDCIIFNAGTDVYEHDELGSFMGLTKQQIINRDQIVFEFAKEQKIPIIQVLSGGYNKQMGAEIVADCLINSYRIMWDTKN